MEEVTVKGLRIAFQRKGKGQELVLLHGALSDSIAWKNQIEELSKDFSVIAWENPGCGVFVPFTKIIVFAFPNATILLSLYKFHIISLYLYRYDSVS